MRIYRAEFFNDLFIGIKKCKEGIKYSQLNNNLKKKITLMQ